MLKSESYKQKLSSMTALATGLVYNWYRNHGSFCVSISEDRAIEVPLSLTSSTIRGARLTVLYIRSQVSIPDKQKQTFNLRADV